MINSCQFFNLEATGKPGRLVEIDDTEKIFSNPSQKATEDYTGQVVQAHLGAQAMAGQPR